MKTYKIPNADSSEAFNSLAEIIKDKIENELKDLGYQLYIIDDSLGIEGYMAFFSHPTKVTQLMLGVNTEFDVISKDEVVIDSVYAQLTITRVNISTDYLENIIDFPETSKLFQLWDMEVKNNEITLDLTKISSDSVIEDVLETVFDAERRFFDMFKKSLRDNNFENVYGKIGEKASVFKSIDDVCTYLENFDIDPKEFGVNENIEILMPDNVKDVFLF